MCTVTSHHGAGVELSTRGKELVRHHWHIPVALLMGLALQGCSESVGPAEGSWGRAEDGIQAMLHSPRAVWKVGEAIELRVRLRNQKGEIRNFPSGADLLLKVSRGDEPLADDVDYVTLADEGIKLSPGHVVDFPLRHYATAGDDATVCKGPGLYRFAGKLGDQELPPLEVRVE